MNKMKKLTGRLGKRLMAAFLAIVMLCMLLPANSAEAATKNAGQAIAMGIDVSKYNGKINWSSVAASGVTFTFIKAGSTNSGMDPNFKTNITGAQKAGIKTGVYLYSYATSVEEAQAEATMLVGWLEPYAISMPVVYDVEASVQKSMSKDQLQAMINAFCAIISAAGYYPMVYSSRNWFNQRIGDVDYDKWIAQYADALDYSGSHIAFWQSTSSGSIAGVSGRVDIDYQYKDYSSLIISDGFLDRNGQTLFFTGYKMQRGWVEWAEQRFYMDENGFLQYGWFADEKGVYYLDDEDGHMLTGLYQIGDGVYFFNEKGVRQTGWVTLGEDKYYFDPETGMRQYGWFADEKGVYYLDDEDGHMLTGLHQIGDGVYLFNEKGVRQTGWVTLADGNKYYFDPETGMRVSGWFGDETGVYYFDEDYGYMMTGDLTIGKNTYYLDENGRVFVGVLTREDGTQYHYGADGVLVKNTDLTLDGALYHADEQGVMTLIAEALPEE